MKALYGAFATVVAIASLAQAQSAKSQAGQTRRERLIGAWHLAHIDAPGPEGKPIGHPSAERHADLYP